MVGGLQGKKISIMEVQLLFSIVSGTLTGFILGLTGSGGAIIAVPMLIFGLDLTVAEAAPIALFSVAVSASVAAYTALRQNIVRYRAAILIAITGMLITPAGVWVARQLPDTLLTALFAGVLMFAAWYMYQKSHEENEHDKALSAPPCQLSLESGRLIWTIPCAKDLAFSGLATGALSGLLGVGGGFVIVPALRKVSDLPMETLTATSLAIIALISTVGVVSATSMGYMNWWLALPFSAGMVAGTLLARRIVRRFDETKLQRSFAILAWGIAISMIIKAAYMMLS